MLPIFGLKLKVSVIFHLQIVCIKFLYMFTESEMKRKKQTECMCLVCARKYNNCHMNYLWSSKIDQCLYKQAKWLADYCYYYLIENRRLNLNRSKRLQYCCHCHRRLRRRSFLHFWIRVCYALPHRYSAYRIGKSCNHNDIIYFSFVYIPSIDAENPPSVTQFNRIQM